MRNTKDEVRRITLISLVITIILLLILAGITMIQLTKDGLFTRAKQAKMISDYTSAKEIVELGLMEIQTKCIAGNKEYTIIEITKNMKEDSSITIERYYNKNYSLTEFSGYN